MIKETRTDNYITIESYLSLNQSGHLADDSNGRNIAVDAIATPENGFRNNISERSFSGKIVHAIAARKNSGSIVIGLSSTSDSRKSAVLKHISGELLSVPDTKAVWFNPLNYTDEFQLSKAFFDVLSESVSTSASNSSDNSLSKLLSNYSDMLLHGGNMSFKSVSNEKNGKTTGQFSILNTGIIKKRIDQALEIRKNRIVILINNVDKLERPSLASLFRLIRLNASFPYFLYVIALDKDKVADTLGNFQGARNFNAGRQLLNKIVQLFIDIPEFTLRSDGNKQQIRAAKEKKVSEVKIPPESHKDTNFRQITEGEQTLETEIETLFDQIEYSDRGLVKSRIEKLSGSFDSEDLIQAMISAVGNLSENTKIALIRGLSSAAGSFRNPETLFSFSSIFSHPAVLIFRILRSIEDSSKRFDIAREVLSESQPVSFAFECFRWISSAPEISNEEMLFDQKSTAELGEIISQRIALNANQGPVYVTTPKEAPFLLSVWSYLSGKEVTENYLRSTFKEDKNNIIYFLKCFMPETKDNISKTSVNESIFNLDQFDRIAKLVEPKTVFSSLLESLGEDFLLDNSTTESIQNLIGKKFAETYKTFNFTQAPVSNEPEVLRKDTSTDYRRKLLIVKKGIYRPLA